MKELIAKCSLLIFFLAIVTLAIFPIGADAEDEGTLITEIPSPTTKPEDTERQIWNILREEFSEVATAAIIGNLKYESGLVPYRYEHLTLEESETLNSYWHDNKAKFTNSDYGYGLAMWTGGMNLTRLWNWCEENGYAVDSIEGQVRFLIADYEYMAPMSFRRMALYGINDIVSATEDFRQSYEKSAYSEYSKYKRARYAKDAFATYCEDIMDIPVIAKVPYDFEIYEKVKKLNKRLEAGYGDS